jgi:hypothetical protein
MYFQEWPTSSGKRTVGDTGVGTGVVEWSRDTLWAVSGAVTPPLVIYATPSPSL